MYWSNAPPWITACQPGVIPAAPAPLSGPVPACASEKPARTTPVEVARRLPDDASSRLFHELFSDCAGLRRVVFYVFGHGLRYELTPHQRTVGPSKRAALVGSETIFRALLRAAGGWCLRAAGGWCLRAVGGWCMGRLLRLAINSGCMCGAGSVCCLLCVALCHSVMRVDGLMLKPRVKGCARH